MTPKNSSYRKDTCAETSGNCIIWDGPDLPCIQLCKGDSITDAVFKFATEYCTFKDSLDLTDLDLSCLFEACQSCPAPEKSIKNIFALLRDKVCSLEDIINDLNPTNVIEPEPFNVNLKCLAITDGSGNILNDDTQDEQVQSIIDATCSTIDDVELIQNQVEDHEIRIVALENSNDDDIPTVTSDCVFIGSKPVDQAYELLDSDYCSTKTALGTPEDIDTAIGQACNLPALIGNPAFIVNPANLAESINNIWLAVCNINARIGLIETNCCAATCDDVKIGFAIAFNEDSTATLTFNAGSGTTIPNGWVDCGSILKVSDTSGNSITVSLTIVPNYTSPNIDLTAFNKGTTLTFSLDVKMCSDGMVCQKCITKSIEYASSECCTYTNNGGNDITLIYQTSANS